MAKADGPDASKPSVIASHVNVVYRVTGSRERTPGDRRRSWRSFLGDSGDRAPRTVHAVRDVSFVAHHGEAIGLIGRNGSGKSTLLKAVAGLIPPTSGDVWTSGTPALLGVNAVLVKSLSGARNIYIGAQALGLSRAQVDAAFSEIVDFSGIGDAIYLPMSTYSSGMAARLRFAISTAASPDVLVIDEALATGDADFKQRSGQRIEAMRKAASTVFLVSHSASTITQMCSRAIWLERGEVVADGPADDVVNQYRQVVSGSRLGSGVEVSEPAVPGVERWMGTTKFDSCAVAARQCGLSEVDQVYLINGSDPHLATTFAVIAAAAPMGALVLPSQKHRCPTVIQRVLSRLLPRCVTLVGDTDLLSDQVSVDVVSACGVEPERVAGHGKIAAITELVDALGSGPRGVSARLVGLRDPSSALVAALRASRDGGRVIVVGAQRLGTGVDDLVARLSDDGVEIYGDDSVISETSARAVLEPEKAITRVVAPTLPIASAQCSRDLYPQGASVVYVAGAESLGHAVTATAAAAVNGIPLLVVDRDDVPSAVAAELRRLQPSHIVVLGPTNAVSAAVRRSLADYLSDEVPSTGHIDL